MKSKIIILCGIPAAGKSTWTKNYIKNNSWSTYSISRDDIRDLLPQPYVYTKDNENKVTRIFNNKLEHCIARGFDIVLDNCHCREKYIDELLNRPIFSLADKYNVYVKFFDIPLWKAYYRAIKRRIQTGKDIPLKVIRDMYKNYKKIDKNKYKDIAI